MPDNKTQLTRADAYALAHIPNGRWFASDEAHYAIKNRYARMTRLVQMGQLEDRVVGEYPDLKREFRRITPL